MAGVAAGRGCPSNEAGGRGETSGTDAALPNGPPARRAPTWIDRQGARAKWALGRVLAGRPLRGARVCTPEDYLEGPFDADETCRIHGRRGLAALIGTDPPTPEDLRPWFEGLPGLDAMEALARELDRRLDHFASDDLVVDCSELPCILGVPVDHDALLQGSPSLIVAGALAETGYEPLRVGPGPLLDHPSDWVWYPRVASDAAIVFVAPIRRTAEHPPIDPDLEDRLEARAIALELQRTAEVAHPDGPCAGYAEILAEELWGAEP